MNDAQVQTAVEAALAGLPEMERAVLVLYHQEACSYEGIAAALGMPVNTVRTHLHRGRKRIAEVLRGRVLRGQREALHGEASSVAVLGEAAAEKGVRRKASMVAMVGRRGAEGRL